MNLTTLTGQVECILASEAETRNSDITLMIELWKRFYPLMVHTESGIAPQYSEQGNYVLLKNLYDLPREDNIKRIRAKFQNDEHKYLPTVEEIAVQRGILAETWRKLMSCPEAHAQVECKVDRF